jgi:germination protein M
MAIYSIVNSLCKLDQINRVQIMIGSGENATILESDDLSNTFAADESFVLTQSGTSSD